MKIRSVFGKAFHIWLDILKKIFSRISIRLLCLEFDKNDKTSPQTIMTIPAHLDSISTESHYPATQDRLYVDPNEPCLYGICNIFINRLDSIEYVIVLSNTRFFPEYIYTVAQ